MAGRFYQLIVEAIKKMHSQYGTGDVATIRMFADGRIELHTRPDPRIVRGRLVGGKTIKIYGKQTTVKE